MSVDLSDFKRRLVYQDQATSTELDAALNQIRQLDHDTERQLRAIRWSMAIAFLGMLACGIVFFVTEIKILLLIAVACAVVFAATLIAVSLKGKFDLSNRRYELVSVLADLLSRDMPKDATFNVSLDLAPPNHARKKSNQDTVGPWDVTYFEDPWLSLAGRFADGTAFEISMLERYQARIKRYRSRSGKSKSKSKSKSATVATVKLFPKQKRYANLARVTDQASRFLKLPNWVQVKKVNVNPDGLVVAAVTSKEWSVRTATGVAQAPYDGAEIMITMLLSLYQILHASNALPAA